jgi:hypothetical protein
VRRLCAGTVRTEDRLAADPGAEAHAPEADGPGVEPGAWWSRRVTALSAGSARRNCPAVLRAALDAGLPVRRVQHVPPGPLTTGPPGRRQSPGPGRVPEPGDTRCCAPGPAAHPGAVGRRARSAVPGRAGILYSSDAGPPLQAAAFTAIVLAPLMAWITVLAQRVDGLLIGRAFATHVGGRPASPMRPLLRLAANPATSSAAIAAAAPDVPPSACSYLPFVVASKLQ